MPTHTTRPGGIVFRNIRCIDANGPGFVRDVLDKLAVCPLAHALILVPPCVRSIGNVTDITNREMSDFLSFCKLDDLATSLVETITSLPLKPSAGLSGA